MIPLNTITQKTISEFDEFNDYDDANLIAYYQSLDEKSKAAVDNVLTYLCGTTFEWIINEYEKQDGN